MTPEQQKELPELLRLTALALGDGWEVKWEKDQITEEESPYLSGNGHSVRPHDNGDSRWMECELLIDVIHYAHTNSVSTVFGVDCESDAVVATEDLADHNNSRQAATCWAVLRCAAELGRMKEKANADS